LTLVVPGFNDDPVELRSIARFIADINPDIPWHVTAFHKDYKMTIPDNTTAHDLIRAAEIGAEEGLHFVYAGNLPGRVDKWEDTRCPHCQITLIKRFGYLIQSYSLSPDGRCPSCRTKIAGIWPVSGLAEVRTGTSTAAYYDRLPRPVSIR
jgi:pyruvate formate lyase activating enzyme